jgi:hypothetical protein
MSQTDDSKFRALEAQYLSLAARVRQMTEEMYRIERENARYRYMLHTVEDWLASDYQIRHPGPGAERRLVEQHDCRSNSCGYQSRVEHVRAVLLNRDFVDLYDQREVVAKHWPDGTPLTAPRAIRLGDEE